MDKENKVMTCEFIDEDLMNIVKMFDCIYTLLKAMSEDETKK